jgi:predicted GNAT family N-acyltransferase
MGIRVVQAVTEAERALGRALRHAVFVVEQAVPPEVEVDGLDDECQHFLALLRQTAAEADDAALATARARITQRGWKIERVAVARAHRGLSVGAELVRHLLVQAPRGLTVYVHAQESALGFWQRMGFIAEGSAFVEGGIPHRLMCWAAEAAQAR